MIINYPSLHVYQKVKLPDSCLQDAIHEETGRHFAQDMEQMLMKMKPSLTQRPVSRDPIPRPSHREMGGFGIGKLPSGNLT